MRSLWLLFLRGRKTFIELKSPCAMTCLKWTAAIPHIPEARLRRKFGRRNFKRESITKSRIRIMSPPEQHRLAYAALVARSERCTMNSILRKSLRRLMLPRPWTLPTAKNSLTLCCPRASRGRTPATPMLATPGNMSTWLYTLLPMRRNTSPSATSP